MTRVVVRPGVVSGRLRAPPSKSYTHRALVAAFLARRPYDIVEPLVADDTVATRTGLVRLGAEVEVRPHRWRLRPRPTRTARRATIDCHESGTTFRFLTAVAAARDGSTVFRGAPGLARRPIRGLLTPLTGAGASARTTGGRSLPLELRGPIRPGRFRVEASTSSQYASALLLVLPTLDGPSTLELVGAPVSEPYLEATLAVLRAQGVRVAPARGGWRIPGPQTYTARRFDVPGDASSAAYLWAAAAATGGRVEVRGVPRAWPQADRKILEALASAGATVRDHRRGAVVEGPLTEGFDLDLTDAPDLYPLLGTLAALVPARSYLRGAEHVAVKESDRRAATIRLVRALGGTAEGGRRALRIEGTAHPRAARWTGLDDHRVVMSAAVGALAADGPTSISDAACVAKSFPGFWEALAGLGGTVEAGR